MGLCIFSGSATLPTLSPFVMCPLTILHVIGQTLSRLLIPLACKFDLVFNQGLSGPTAPRSGLALIVLFLVERLTSLLGVGFRLPRNDWYAIQLFFILFFFFKAVSYSVYIYLILVEPDSPRVEVNYHFCNNICVQYRSISIADWLIGPRVVFWFKRLGRTRCSAWDLRYNWRICYLDPNYGHNVWSYFTVLNSELFGRLWGQRCLLRGACFLSSRAGRCRT